MSPQRTDPAPRPGGKVTAIVALVAALIGGGGGIAVTPMIRTTDAYITKADLADALTPMNAKLEKIETALTDLHAEAAVARYAREHSEMPRLP